MNTPPPLPKGFLELDEIIYAGFPNSIPENADAVRKQFSAANEFFAKGEAWVDAIPGRARLAAFVSPSIHWNGTPVAWFGYWETLDDPEPTCELLGRLGKWLRPKGIPHLMGPVNFSTHGRYRLLHGAAPDTPTFQGEPFNPGWYPQLLEALGFEEAERYITTILESAAPSMQAYFVGAPQPSDFPDLEFRRLDGATWLKYLPEFHELVEASFAKNPGFVSMGFETFRAALGESYARTLCPESSVVVFQEGDPVAMCLCFPDYGPLLARGSPGRLAASELSYAVSRPLLAEPTMILKTIGIHPRWQGLGLQKTIFRMTYDGAKAAGYRWIMGALVRSDNRSRMDQKLGGDMWLRTYSLYRKNVESLP